jgi:formylglycine-generating enzyme
MDYLLSLRRRLFTLFGATFLAVSVWAIDYVILPPVWSMFIVASNFNTLPIAAAQETLNNTPMSKIPAGSFWRGYHQGLPDERVEQIIFTDEFYIDRYEVIRRDYQRCVKFGTCRPPRPPLYLQDENLTIADSNNLPVTWVTWQDAQAYCRFLHKRLPTEAEWEKAARGPDAFLYPWGNQEPASQGSLPLRTGRVTVGGAYPPDQSRYGVYDMAANVREWVADWYQWEYYERAPQQNPLGAEQGETKAVRGGSWSSDVNQLRLTRRANVLPTTAEADLGFRCASSTFPPTP